MSRRVVNPPELYEGVPYSYVSIAPEGGTVFTAGACPLDADGAIVGRGDVALQTRQTLDNRDQADLLAACFKGQLVEIEAVAAR